jgi:hypothetical protein
MKLKSTLTKANGKQVPRCQARKISGHVGFDGREQCSRPALPGRVFCGTHLRAKAARLEKKTGA